MQFIDKKAENYYNVCKGYLNLCIRNVKRDKKSLNGALGKEKTCLLLHLLKTSKHAFNLLELSINDVANLNTNCLTKYLNISANSKNIVKQEMSNNIKELILNYYYFIKDDDIVCKEFNITQQQLDYIKDNLHYKKKRTINNDTKKELIKYLFEYFLKHRKLPIFKIIKCKYHEFTKKIMKNMSYKGLNLFLITLIKENISKYYDGTIDDNDISEFKICLKNYIIANIFLQRNKNIINSSDDDDDNNDNNVEMTEETKTIKTDNNINTEINDLYYLKEESYCNKNVCNQDKSESDN